MRRCAALQLSTSRSTVKGSHAGKHTPASGRVVRRLSQVCEGIVPCGRGLRKRQNYAGFRLNVIDGCCVETAQIKLPTIMKTLLLTALMFTALFALPAKAKGGGYRERYVRDYDCGRPVYRYVNRDDCYYPQRYSYYRQPVRSYYRSQEYCAPRVRYYSRPRFSFHIGF